MNSDDVYMINDEGQIILVANDQDVSLKTNVVNKVQTSQKNNVSNQFSQINPVVQNSPMEQPSIRQNNVRNVGGVKYTQNKPPVSQQVQPQVYQRPQAQQQVYQRPQPQVQPQVYQRPQSQVQQQVQQQVQPQVYQRPQLKVQPQAQQPQTPFLNTRTLNRQDESLSYNNWKKMNLNLTQMVNDNNQYQVKTLQQNEGSVEQSEQIDETQIFDDTQEVNFEDNLNTNQPEFTAGSNRAKYGTFVSNNTSHNTKNNGSIRSNHIPSYLAIRKAHNSENIYL